MLNHTLNSNSAIAQILSGIEVSGVVVKVLSNSSSHSKSQVGIDIDLANSLCSSLAEHLFRDTDSIGHLAAVFVDHLNEFGNNGACTMENDGEAGKTSSNFIKNIETELGLLAGLELVCAMACTDSDSKRINACAGYEIENLIRVGVGSVFSRNVNIVFNTAN